MAKFEGRINYIGGSDFATVLDINKYKKRIELVLEKAGVIVNNFEGNEATRRGELLEDIVIEMFEEETGLKVSDKQKEFEINEENCIQLKCHVDGITSDNCLFEAKTTDINSKTWVNEEIPLGYQAQLEFNCFLSGLKKAYIAVAFCDENEIVKFDYKEYIPSMAPEHILDICKQFTNEINKYKKIGVVNNGLVVRESFDNSLIEELSELNEKIKEIKKQITPFENRKKEIESILKEKIGTNLGIENDLYKITMSNRITSPIQDYKISRSSLKIEYKE